MKIPNAPLTAAQLHSAGAIVRHKSPFHDLPTPTNDAPLSQQMIDDWGVPFYMDGWITRKTAFAGACARATPEILFQLLGEFNWRPRSVAARIIAVQRTDEFQEKMSNLFLKSEVCCVGRDYCLALTRLANPDATETLCRYLDYYLARKDLHYDQSFAMAALVYLDKKQGSKHCNQFGPRFKTFSGKGRGSISSGVMAGLAARQSTQKR